MEPGTLKAKSNLDLLYIGIYEFYGTFILLCALNTANGFLVPLEIGICLFIGLIIAGGISGGHFNGAVTLGIYLLEGKWKENILTALVIFIADLIGGFAGLLFSHFVKDGKEWILAPPNLDHSFIFVFFVEMIFTFIFVSSIIHVKYSKITSTKDGMLASLLIALSLFGCIAMSNRMTSACLNPIVGFTATIF